MSSFKTKRPLAMQDPSSPMVGGAEPNEMQTYKSNRNMGSVMSSVT